MIKLKITLEQATRNSDLLHRFGGDLRVLACWDKDSKDFYVYWGFWILEKKKVLSIKSLPLFLPQ